MYTAYVTLANGSRYTLTLMADTWAKAYDLAWRKYPKAIEIEVL